MEKFKDNINEILNCFDGGIIPDDIPQDLQDDLLDCLEFDEINN